MIDTSIYDYKDVASAKRVIALGAFDGVHIAHRAVIENSCKCAKILSAIPTVLTFYTDPSQYLGKPQSVLTDFATREKLMFDCGAKDIIYAEFDAKFADVSPESFASFLKNKLGAVALVCGKNYTFGSQGTGDTVLLQALCENENMLLCIIDEVCYKGITVSSSAIRRALQQGRIEAANDMLGRFYTFHGKVERGKHIGNQLGFPTANISLKDNFAIPKCGVYASIVTIDSGVSYMAVTNIGVRPSFDNGKIKMESNIIDFDGDLYDKMISVSLVAFLRDERKFDRINELIEQISADKIVAENILSNM